MERMSAMVRFCLPRSIAFEQVRNRDRGDDADDGDDDQELDQ
jgi:hypothetical protein